MKRKLFKLFSFIPILNFSYSLFSHFHIFLFHSIQFTIFFSVLLFSYYFFFLFLFYFINLFVFFFSQFHSKHAYVWSKGIENIFAAFSRRSCFILIKYFVHSVLWTVWMKSSKYETWAQHREAKKKTKKYRNEWKMFGMSKTIFRAHANISSKSFSLWNKHSSVKHMMNQLDVMFSLPIFFFLPSVFLCFLLLFFVLFCFLWWRFFACQQPIVN